MAVSGGGQPRGGDAVRVWRHRWQAVSESGGLARYDGDGVVAVGDVGGAGGGIDGDCAGVVAYRGFRQVWPQPLVSDPLQVAPLIMVTLVSSMLVT